MTWNPGLPVPIPDQDESGEGGTSTEISGTTPIKDSGGTTIGYVGVREGGTIVVWHGDTSIPDGSLPSAYLELKADEIDGYVWVDDAGGSYFNIMGAYAEFAAYDASGNQSTLGLNPGILELIVEDPVNGTKVIQLLSGAQGAGFKVQVPIEILNDEDGLILTAPDGTPWRVTVGNDGILTTTEVV